MNKPFLPRLYFPAIALVLVSCMSPTDVRDSQPKGLLYRCIGIAGYEPGAMDSLIAYFAKNPPICKDGIDLAFDMGALKVSSEADSMSVTMVVLDDECNFLEETSFKSPDDSIQIPHLFSGKTKEGVSLPTGEYYVNYRLVHPDQSSDTAYTKVGFVRNRCAP